MIDPRVGVVFRPQSPPEALYAAVSAAEAAGLDELWLWEDCFEEGGLTAATAALAWSERLAVGIGLLPVPLRNPALAAMEIATLARLFPGRFLPALGHGVLEWMGQVGARASSPMTLLREYTGAVRALLSGATVDVDGRFVHLERVALGWPPEQVPPLLVGARGPKTVRLAGEVGDGVLLDSYRGPITSKEEIAAHVGAVRDGAALVGEAASAAGRDAPQVVVFVEVEPASDGLTELVAAVVAEYGAAGATSVVLQGTHEAPDAGPLIAALGERA